MTDSRIWHIEYGQGMPLVLIHGYTMDHRLLLPLEPAFTHRPGWRRLYLDLPGHGNSNRLPVPHTATVLTDTVIDWIQNVIGEQPFVVLGQSFGGQIARAVTAHFGSQVLGSALLVPVVRWNDDRALPEETTIAEDQALMAALPTEDGELFRAVTARLSSRNWELFQRHILPGWRVHDRPAAAELENAFLLPEWPEINAPTHRGPHLLVTTRQDALVGWRDQLELLDHYPRMSATVLDGAGHNPQVESAVAVRNLLGQWLEDRITGR
ncbi:alpha/beta hydrolase [Nocardia sp. NPDC047648]|uniref:alpha/beta fold hydrolase n=1 Tax=Nocardia sp. NPDC047648 TaxID=3155625 RepID=UPI0033DAF432